MKDELISFSTAKLAKEKGFDLETDNYYYHGAMVNSDLAGLIYSDEKDFYFTPTQSLLQRWLREVHSLNYVDVFPQGNKLWGVDICFLGSPITEIGEDFETYELALEAGLNEALKTLN